MSFMYKYLRSVVLGGAIAAAPMSLAQEPPPLPVADDPVTGEMGVLPPATPPAPVNPWAVWEERKRMGELAYAKGDYKAAESFFMEYFVNPRDQDWLTDAASLVVRAKLAQVATNPKKAAEAVALLDGIPQRLRELPNAIPGVQEKLSGLNEAELRLWRARALFAKGDMTSAEKTYERLIKQNTSPRIKSMSHLGLGEVYLRQGDAVKARAQFEKMKTESWEPEAKQRGEIALIRVLNAEENWAEAEKRFFSLWDQAIPLYKNELGMLYIATLVGAKKPNLAIKFFRENFADSTDFMREPDYYQTLFVLAEQLSEQSQYRDALHIYRKLYDNRPTDAQQQELLMRMGDTNLAAGNYGDANLNYKMFLDTYPEHASVPRVMLKLAQTLEKAGEHEKAFAKFDEVDSPEVKAPLEVRYDARMLKAELYERLERWNDARGTYLKAVALPMPDDARAEAMWRAGVLTKDKLKEYPMAASLLKQVADLYPDSEHAPDARYHEGRCYEEEGQFTEAAQAFGQFVETWPQHEQAPVAMRAKGTNQYRSGAYTDATRTLESYATSYREADDAADALLEAAAAANAAGRDNDAIQILNRIEADYKETQAYPLALYERGYLRLSRALYAEGLADCNTFLQNFVDVHPERARHVYLWLGDHHASEAKKEVDARENFRAAKTYFMALVERFPKSEEAPIALYEAAKNAYYQQAFRQAGEYLDRLARDYPNAPARIKASALYLNGDIASHNSDFTAAAAYFQQVIEQNPNKTITWAAHCRRAECLANLAHAADKRDESKALYNEALAEYQTVIDNANAGIVDPHLRNKAHWSVGRIYEDLNDPEEAIKHYKTVFFAYEASVGKNGNDHYLFFARAGYALARLYEETAQPNLAAVVYTSIANADIPVSNDARARAAKLSAAVAMPAGAPGATPPPTTPPTP